MEFAANDVVIFLRATYRQQNQGYSSTSVWLRKFVPTRTAKVVTTHPKRTRNSSINSRSKRRHLQAQNNFTSPKGLLQNIFAQSTHWKQSTHWITRPHNGLTPNQTKTINGAYYTMKVECLFSSTSSQLL